MKVSAGFPSGLAGLPRCKYWFSGWMCEVTLVKND